MNEPEKPKYSRRVHGEDDDREGGHNHPTKDLSPDDFDIENEREKGDEHLRRRS